MDLKQNNNQDMVYKSNIITRREVIKAGGFLSLSPFLTTTVKATTSGEIELEYNCDIPTGDFSISIEVRERLVEDTAPAWNNVEEIELSNGFDEITLEELEGGQNYDNEYQLYISMNGDSEDTPKLHEVHLYLPEREQPDTTSWVDNFSNGNAKGWIDDDGNEPNVTDESITITDYSLYGVDGGSDQRIAWDDAPILDVQEEFTVSGVIKSEIPDDRTRIGLLQDHTSGAILIFSDEYSATYLATDIADEPGEDSYPTSFDDTWVEFEIHSPEKESILKAKVWEYEHSEPEEYELETEFENIESGEFAISPGGSNSGREIYLDMVTIQGEEFVPEPDDDLRLGVRDFIEIDRTLPYTVNYNDPEEGWKDVTEEADVSSSDSSIVSVDNENNEYTGESRGETTLTVEHEGLETPKSITCADIIIADLDLLPFDRKVQAVMNDRTMQSVYMATIIGVAAAKIAKSQYAGLGLMGLILLIAWIAGFISSGIVLVAIPAIIILSFALTHTRPQIRVGRE